MVAEATKRKRIKNYFRDESVLGNLILIVFGIATLVFIVGIIFLHNGIRGFVRQSTRPSDLEIDSWTDADIPQRVLRAKELSGITSLAREPLEIRHAVAGQLLGDAESLQKLGRDNEWRYSPVGVSVVLLADQQACIYQSAIDLTTGVPINERVYEFFYQDVVDIGWKHETQTINYRTYGFIGRQFIRMTLGFVFDRKQRQKTLDLLRYVGRLRKQHRAFIVDKVLQRNLYTTFVVTLENGVAIEVPVFDGRPAIEASRGAGGDPNKSRALLEVARAFIREKKLMLLGDAGRRAGGAPLI